MNTVKTIRLGMISGNVYLVQAIDSCILIDTGLRSKRSVLTSALEEYSRTMGRLTCILLTHGDFDHCGNALYLSKKFKIPVGIHRNDAVVLEQGDMFINRKRKNPIIGFVIRKCMGIKKFSPDFYLDDHSALGQYAMNMKVIHTPGHSPGSVCLITSDGDCFCGDLFENTRKPQINKIADDVDEMKNSARKIMESDITTIYPGHGKPFLKKDLTGLFTNTINN
jgi:glyoxylase-like metal-dependent hydrolase (beta-lactamase superfamily II)